MKWFLFFTLHLTAPMSANGPFNDKADCLKVQEQIEKQLRPIKSACIEMPKFMGEK